MFHFQYIEPKNLEEALELLRGNTGDTCVMAGGTDLLLRFRSERCSASRVVSLDLPELRTMAVDAGRIGPGVSLTAVIDALRDAPEPLAMLSRAAESVGACQTRNLATIGGNFCTGNASSDMATALLAAGAQVTIRSADAERTLPLERFFLANRKLALSPEEIVTEIRIPRHEGLRFGAEFQKVGKRRGHVIAALNAAAVIGTDTDGVIRQIRLAVGTLAPTPLRLFRCEEAALNRPVTEELLQELSALILEEIHPRDSLRASKAYRLEVAPRLLRRVILTSVGMEEPCK